MAEIIKKNITREEMETSWYDLQSDEVKNEIDMAVLERVKHYWTLENKNK
jgi:hypothetical protein